MTTNATYFRHGDVILRRLSDDEKIQGEKQKHLTLAEGEVTGHSHRISKGKGELFKFNDKMFLKIQSKIACLTHEEHKKIELPAGDYEVIIQREYTPDGWKKVTD